MSKKKIDWMVTVIPFMIIVGIVAVLFVFPKQANMVISQVRFFWRYFGDILFDSWYGSVDNFYIFSVFKIWKHSPWKGR